MTETKTDELKTLPVPSTITLPAVGGSAATPPTPIEFRNEFEIGDLLKTAGQVELTKAQAEILYSPVNKEDVEIRPDGLIYLPWMEYATRLTKAFGLQWALIPQGMPKVKETFIYWGFWLIIQGKLMGFAIGEQEYHPTNRTMSWSDATEGAKSNALMRLCKGLGVSLELWKPSFIKAWVFDYAEKYWDETKKKYLWRKKGVSKSPKLPPETALPPTTEPPSPSALTEPTPSEPPKSPPIEVLYLHKLMTRRYGKRPFVEKALKELIGKTSFFDVTIEEAKELVAKLETDSEGGLTPVEQTEKAPWELVS